MKTTLFSMAILLLLILSVLCVGCDMGDFHSSEIPGTTEESRTETGSQTESDTTDGSENTENSSDTEGDETESAGGVDIDDAYPNEPDDGHTKRY